MSYKNIQVICYLQVERERGVEASQHPALELDFFKGQFEANTSVRHWYFFNWI